MLRYSLLITLIFISINLKAQTNTSDRGESNRAPGPDYFFAEDVLFGGVPYLLLCKELEKSGIRIFKIELKKDKQVRSFEMVDIKPTQKTISIFQTQLLNQLDKLNESLPNIITKKDSLKVQQITENISETDPNPTIEEKFFLNELIDKTSLKYGFNSRMFDSYFEPLKTKLDSARNPTYLKDLTKKMESAKMISVSQKGEIKNQLKISSSEYLFNIYIKSIEMADSAPEVGTLYAQKKAKLFIYEADEKKIKKQISKLKNKIKHTLKIDTFNMAALEKNRLYLEKNRLYHEIDSLNRFLAIDRQDSLDIHEVEIEFEYEQIANIKVIANYVDRNNRNNKLAFQNRIPIAYSTKADVSRDKGITRGGAIKLFETKDHIGYSSYIKMDDVFFNDYRLLNQTENYSPKDQIITIKPGEKGKVLKKEKVTNILKAKVFSDFVGFDSTEPNGLIQTEVSHRFYFNTYVHQFGGSYYYWGVFNSAMSKITLSKIESNNRIFTIDTKPLLNDTVQLFANTIDVFKHSSWTSGAELNIAYLGLPFLQSMVYLNFGAYIRHVPMRVPTLDTTSYFQPFQDNKIDNERKFNVNVVALFPELTWSISPHSRFRISYTMKYFRLFHLTDDFEMVSNKELFFNDSEESKDSKPWLLSLKFLAAIRTSENANGELFFRTYFNFLTSNPSQNFFQAQVGYAFNIFDRKKEPAPRKPLEEL